MYKSFAQTNQTVAGAVVEGKTLKSLCESLPPFKREQLKHNNSLKLKPKKFPSSKKRSTKQFYSEDKIHYHLVDHKQNTYTSLYRLQYSLSTVPIISPPFVNFPYLNMKGSKLKMMNFVRRR